MAFSKFTFVVIVVLLLILGVFAEPESGESLRGNRIRRGSILCSIGSGSATWSKDIYYQDHRTKQQSLPQEVILEISSWKSPLIGVIVGPAYHEFIVLKTATGYWSVEKACEGITVARGTWEEIYGYYRNEGRQGKATLNKAWKKAKSGSTTTAVINWVKTGELSRGYNLLLDNCQHFAGRLYSKISA